MLLWLWRRLAATAPIKPLAWEPPYATGSSPRKKKKEKKRERNSDTNESPSSSGETREFRRQNEKLGFTYFEFRDKTNFQWKSNRQLEIGEHIYAKSKISDTDLIACTLSEQIN